MSATKLNQSPNSYGRIVIPSRLDSIRSKCARAFGQDPFEDGPKTAGSAKTLPAPHSLEELAEGHLEGGSKSRQMAKPHFARTALEIGDVNLVNTRLFGQVDLPPTTLLAELADSFAKLNAHIEVHSSSIDLVEALYLVDALSGPTKEETNLRSRFWMRGSLSRCSSTTRGEVKSVALFRIFGELKTEKRSTTERRALVKKDCDDSL